jgi:hypothetical protein
MDWVGFYHCFFKQGFDFYVSKPFWLGVSVGGILELNVLKHEYKDGEHGVSGYVRWFFCF